LNRNAPAAQAVIGRFQLAPATYVRCQTLNPLSVGIQNRRDFRGNEACVPCEGVEHDQRFHWGTSSAC
jgi:hypothetical protein